MNGSVHAGIAALTAVFVVVVLTARWWNTPVREPGRHRAADRLPSKEVPCGAPTAYADPDAVTQAFGVVRTGFGWCESCTATTAGVITQNGFRCGEFYRHPVGSEAAS